MHSTTVLLLCSLAIASCHVSAQPLEVIQLTDNTFEHQTQAATGQTTGHWCVLLVNSSQAEDPWQIAADDAWHQLAIDDEKTTIFAKVDVLRSPQLAKRFNVTHTPSALLLRDRAMYTLDLAAVRGPDADKLVGAVQEFLAGGYEKQAPQSVPAEANLLSAVKDIAKLVNVQPNWMLYAGLASIAVGILLLLAFVVVGFWYAMPGKPSKPAPAAAAAPDSKPEAAAEAAAPADAAAGDDETEVVKESGEAKTTTTRATRRRA